jgi:sarcosine oxidase delta subunit
MNSYGAGCQESNDLGIIRSEQGNIAPHTVRHLTCASWLGAARDTLTPMFSRVSQILQGQQMLLQRNAEEL